MQGTHSWIVITIGYNDNTKSNPKKLKVNNIQRLSENINELN